MDPRFRPHNTHLDGPASFRKHDPQLRLLAEQPLVHRFALLDALPKDAPGLYSLTGGRQVGKTTVLKQWMAELLTAGTPPSRIRYLTGELVDDHHVLVRLVGEVLSEAEPGPRYLLLDEITYVRDWDKGIKYLADTGLLDDVILVFTGSDSLILREARTRFPGRRGRSAVVDFHLPPLSFLDDVRLRGVLKPSELDTALDARADVPRGSVRRLLEAFGSYLTHGGYLTAINDVARAERVSPSTLATYSDWIRGDMLKRGKQERYLREVLASVVKRQGSQVTWNALAKELSIDHPATVAEYIDLLIRMDVVNVQAALREDTLRAAPKKARKLGFRDPFIYHAVRAWLEPSPDAFGSQIQPAVADPKLAGELAEACVASHLARHHPTHYIKASGEVDVAYVEGRRFRPVEVKWTGQLRPKDLQQVARYDNGLILTRRDQPGEIEGIPTLPLPLFLLRLGPSPVTTPEVG